MVGHPRNSSLLLDSHPAFAESTLEHLTGRQNPTRVQGETVRPTQSTAVENSVKPSSFHHLDTDPPPPVVPFEEA